MLIEEQERMINMFKRIFLIVLDSLGVGEANDASKYGDSGANTLGHIIENKNYNLDVLENLGLISLVKNIDEKTYSYYMKAKPNSLGKDTLNGHYEMMGILSNAPFKTFPEGFPLELITEIKNITNRDVIGNVAASGTEIIEMETRRFYPTEMYKHIDHVHALLLLLHGDFNLDLH